LLKTAPAVLGKEVLPYWVQVTQTIASTTTHINMLLAISGRDLALQYSLTNKAVKHCNISGRPDFARLWLNETFHHVFV
jgi:hypothetical protein